MRWLRRISGIVWIFSWYTIYLEIFRWHHMTKSLRFSPPPPPPGTRIRSRAGAPLIAVCFGSVAAPLVFLMATMMERARGRPGGTPASKDRLAWSRVLFGAVLTAQDGQVSVGARSIVMENTVIRGRARHPVVIGDDVLVGSHAHLNGARVGRRLLPGHRRCPVPRMRRRDRHRGADQQIWGIQESLGFPGTVYGLPRERPAAERTSRQSAWCGANLGDRIIDESPRGQDD